MGVKADQRHRLQTDVGQMRTEQTDYGACEAVISAVEKQKTRQGVEVWGCGVNFNRLGYREASVGWGVWGEVGKSRRMSRGVPFPQEKNRPGRGRNKCKGPKEGDCLECSRNSEGPVWLHQRERGGD